MEEKNRKGKNDPKVVATEMFKEIDRDMNGTLDRSEFIHAYVYIDTVHLFFLISSFVFLDGKKSPNFVICSLHKCKQHLSKTMTFFLCVDLFFYYLKD